MNKALNLYIYLILGLLVATYYLFGGHSIYVVMIYGFLTFVVLFDLKKQNDFKNNNPLISEFEFAVLNSSRDSIIASDLDGVITHFSKGAEELLGYSKEEMIGLQTPAIIHDINEVIKRNNELNKLYNENNKPGFITFVRRVFELDKDENEWTYINKNGSRIPVILSVTPLKSKKGDIIGFLGIATDISKIKQNEIELKIANEKTMISSQAKTIFLANMSHEIRTPLNGIMGMAGLLKGTQLNDEQNSFVKYILDAGEQLQTILGDILDFSKIESGKIDINPKIVRTEEFNHLLQKVLEGFAKEKGLRYYFEEETLPHHIYIDDGRLRQIISNLIVNAVKYTNQGEVRVLCYYKDSNIIYEVRDTGIGISKENLRDLFEPFMQVNHELRNAGGVGLGLSIVKQLVELMDGKIEVESELYVGSTFKVTIPAGEREEVVEESDFDIKNTLIGNKILVVEDNKINQKVITKILEKAGANIEVANNGREAIEKVAREKFNAILMDYQMPELDGPSATKEIRKFNKEVSIIALTANAFEDDKNECLLAGMNDFLSKPVNPKKLIQAILRNLI